MVTVRSAARTLGKMALEKTSSVTSNFTRGVKGAFLSEMPGITAAYGLAKSFSTQASKVDPGSAVVAKETRAGNIINLQMYKEMRATNMGIQNLNRMIGYQTGLEKQRLMFEEEKERERQLENKQLVDAIKKMGAGNGVAGQQAGGGGFLSGLLGSLFGRGAGGLLGAGALAGAGAFAGSKILGSVFGGGKGGGGGGGIGGGAANDPKFKTGPLSRLLGSGALRAGLRFIPYIGTALLAIEALSLLGSFLGPSRSGGVSSRRSTSTSTGSAGQFNIPSGGKSYIDKVISAESDGRNIGNTSSSAFGLGQITKGTFEGLVATARPGDALYGKTFDDYKVNTKLQIVALQKLTEQNFRGLERAGVPTDDASLYLAHFLGAPTALKVLQADDNTPIGDVVGAAAIKANPGVFKNIRTVGDLKAWAARKMGGTYTKGTAAGTGGGRRGGAGGGGPAVSGVIPSSGGGTSVDKVSKDALIVYDPQADKNAKAIVKNTGRTAIAGESNNEATHGKIRPTKVVDTRTRNQRIVDNANAKFFKDFERTTQRVITKGLTNTVRRIFPEYDKMVNRRTASGELYRGQAAGKILNINKKANQIFGKEYGPVFAELGTNYLEAGLSSVGEFLFSDRMGGAGEARVLTGQILGNYARGNKKTAREQLIYGLTGIPTGIDSLSRYILGPTGSPAELIAKTSKVLSGGITDVFSTMTGFGGGTGRSVFGGATSSGADPWGGVDPFGGLEETQKQTSLLEQIVSTSETGNEIQAGFGGAFLKSLGSLGSGLLNGIGWLGKSLGGLIGNFIGGIGSLFGGGGGGGFLNFIGSALNVADNMILGGAGKSLINAGAQALGFNAPFNLATSAGGPSAFSGFGNIASSFISNVTGIGSNIASGVSSFLGLGGGGAGGGFVAGGYGSIGPAGYTATAGAGGFAAAVPYLAAAVALYAIFGRKKKKQKPRLERVIVLTGNNDISQKFTGINISYAGAELEKLTAFLDSFLNVAFTTAKNIEAKTKVDPPMYAIGIEFEVGEELGMKLYLPGEKIPSHAPKERRRYGKTDDKSFNGAKVAAAMAKDIKEFYSRGQQENVMTAITQATNEVTSRTFQELAGGKFAGLGTLDQTVPVSAQEAELARLIQQEVVKGYIPDTGEGGYSTYYNPTTGQYEIGTTPGQLLFDEQGRPIIDVNRNNMVDLQDIEKTRAIYNDRARTEAFMTTYNMSNENQISYNEAIRLQLAQMWAEANYDPYAGGGGT